MSSASGSDVSSSLIISPDGLKAAIRVYELVASDTFMENPEKPTEVEDALKFFQDGAKSGNLDCKYYLAMCSGMGKLGVRENTSLAFRMLTELTNEKHPVGAYSLACAYRDGYWVPKSKPDFDQAYVLFEQVCTSPEILPPRSPYNEMQLILPRTQRGRDMTKQQRNAARLKILEVGCEQNDATCLHNLSMVYIKGEMGQSIDESRGVELEKRAAQFNCFNGKHAKWNLGSWHSKGSYGLEKSWSIVENLWLQADNHDSMQSLGVSYDPDFDHEADEILPPEQSNKKAFEFYTRGANEFGNINSMCNLVNFYDGSKPYPEFPPDPYEAIRLMSEVFEQGVDAMESQLRRFIAKMNMAVFIQQTFLEADAAPNEELHAVRGWKAELAMIELMAEGIIKANLDVAQYYRKQAAEHGAPADELAEVDPAIEEMIRTLRAAEQPPAKRRRGRQ